jgi:hypothetical protein
VVDADYLRVSALELERTFSSAHHMEYRLNRVSDKVIEPSFPLHLRVSGKDLDITVMEPPGLATLVRQLQKNAANLLYG